MTSLSSTPAPARTDVRGPVVTEQATVASSRRAGIILAVGAASWSAAMFAYGANPADDPAKAITDLTGLAFQVGVMALLNAQIRTRALGTGKRLLRALKVERVVLLLAMFWSLVHGAVPAMRDDTWLAFFDICWPLSMFGMFLISLKMLFRGRWRGPARVWCFVSETWFIFTVPAFAIFGQGAADIIGPSHLVIGYITLGVILALKPELTLPRD